MSRPLSLAPDARGAARSAGELCSLLLGSEDGQWRVALIRGLERLERAQAQAFPENIFGDLDFVAASVLRQGRAAESVALLEELFERMCALQQLYGEATAIRFRYVHDFTYGYDWAKWVAREAAQDGSVGPFDLEFLRYMERRGGELLELIAADDRKYPSVRDTGHRNPFVFSREPDAERTLFRALVAADAVPVQTWSVDGNPRWQLDFSALRVRCAQGLGLVVDGAA